MNNEQMNSIIQDETKRLETILKRSAAIIGSSPPGKLWIHKKGDYYFFEISYPDSKEIRYVKKKEADVLAPMVRKYCAESIKSLAEKQMDSIINLNISYDFDLIEKEYSRLYDIFGVLVPDCFLPRKVIIERWKSKKYEKHPRAISPETAVKTETGELVRSKNEAQAANILNRLGIPYHYEERLLLSDKSVWYPDFTIYSPVTGDKFYIEIFGMMSDPKYLEEAARKLESYAKNGIMAGDKLLVFFEFSDSRFDTEVFEQTLRKRVLLS